MIDRDKFYTAEEVAALLRVHPKTVKVWLNAEHLRGARISNRAGWRILGSDLQTFWDERVEAGKETAA
ncbi:MAG: helix-turn-helix domain-containing protein [Xanthobacteraceae bacterium]